MPEGIQVELSAYTEKLHAVQRNSFSYHGRMYKCCLHGVFICCILEFSLVGLGLLIKLIFCSQVQITLDYFVCLCRINTQMVTDNISLLVEHC